MGNNFNNVSGENPQFIFNDTITGQHVDNKYVDNAIALLNRDPALTEELGASEFLEGINCRLNPNYRTKVR